MSVCECVFYQPAALRLIINLHQQTCVTLLWRNYFHWRVRSRSLVFDLRHVTLFSFVPGFLRDGCPGGQLEPLPHWFLRHVVDILSHFALSHVYRSVCFVFVFFEHVCLKSLLLNTPSHLHQPVSNHPSPQVTQKCRQTLSVPTLHQHAHLLRGGWVAAGSSPFCGRINCFPWEGAASGSRDEFMQGILASRLLNNHLFRLSED